MSDETRTDPAAPVVSVVIATYNRPEVLAFAIRSVLAQDYDRWELIVVGDHCTEPTAAVVAAFDDPRIIYANLPLNCGDQSGPNNVGISRARGRYIAFLNHDDLWFPDHLSAAIAWLETVGADLVIARAAAIEPEPDVPPDSGQWSVILLDRGRRGHYDPAVTSSPATCMVIKTATARAARPWEPLAECYWSSAQLWSYRIWRSGSRIRLVPHLTVIKFGSSSRPGAYANNATAEHRYFEALLRKPQTLRVLLLDRSARADRRPAWKRLASPLVHVVMRCAARCGIPPHEMLGRLLGRRRGEDMRQAYRIRGLPPPASHDPPAGELRARYAKEVDASDR
jgi:glycosyltransferase involved in cell wall biosynthesis